MLKIVVSEAGEVLEEKVILDDDNRLTKFGWMLIALDLVIDFCLFRLFKRLLGK